MASKAIHARTNFLIITSTTASWNSYAISHTNSSGSGDMVHGTWSQLFSSFLVPCSLSLNFFNKNETWDFIHEKLNSKPSLERNILLNSTSLFGFPCKAFSEIHCPPGYGPHIILATLSKHSPAASSNVYPILAILYHQKFLRSNHSQFSIFNSQLFTT